MSMSETDLQNIVLAPMLTSVLFVLCYLWCRGVRGGRSLTSVQWKMISYACSFSLVMVYAMLFQDKLASFLHWEQAWIGAIGIWALLLAFLAWHQCKARHSDAGTEKNDGC
jgi:hypothetical protein